MKSKTATPTKWNGFGSKRKVRLALAECLKQLRVKKLGKSQDEFDSLAGLGSARKALKWVRKPSASMPTVSCREYESCPRLLDFFTLNSILRSYPDLPNQVVSEPLFSEWKGRPPEAVRALFSDLIFEL